jgi:hypothetical protein
VVFILSSSGAQRLFDNSVLPNEYNQNIKIIIIIKKKKEKERKKQTKNDGLGVGGNALL